jgi:transposase-like protein
MTCIYCESAKVVKNGTKKLKTGQVIQNYICRDCGRHFNERSGTSLLCLRTNLNTVEMALKVRGEGLGIRATARILDKAPSSISNWEERLSTQLKSWSPQAPLDGEVTIEGNEVYTRVGENLPPLTVSWLDYQLY